MMNLKPLTTYTPQRTVVRLSLDRRDLIRCLILLAMLAQILPVSGCRLTYIFHAASGQFRLLTQAIPVEEALKENTLGPEEKARLGLVAQIKAFGENELGLKETRNYQTVNLKSRQNPVYTVSASPKDSLTMITWWFPVAGRMPYLGFFDLKSAKAEREKLLKEDLDVTIGAADAYSTLGWFEDPVTLNLLEGSTVDLAETILHEMTHTTFYLKGQGEFNEGLAVLVGKVGTVLFMEKTYGPTHPFALEAQRALEDELIFSAFLDSLLEDLERLYDSPMSYKEKLDKRERIFAGSLEAFSRLKGELQTHRFTAFGSSNLNNAYLLSIALYHRHFHLFEAVLKKNQNSIRETLAFFQNLSRQRGNILENARAWLDGH